MVPQLTPIKVMVLFCRARPLELLCIQLLLVSLGQTAYVLCLPQVTTKHKKRFTKDRFYTSRYTQYFFRMGHA